MSKKKKPKRRKKKSIKDLLVIPEVEFEEEIDFTDIDDLSEALVVSCLALDSKRSQKKYIV